MKTEPCKLIPIRQTVLILANQNRCTKGIRVLANHYLDTLLWNRKNYHYHQVKKNNKLISFRARNNERLKMVVDLFGRSSNVILDSE